LTISPIGLRCSAVLGGVRRGEDESPAVNPAPLEYVPGQHGLDQLNTLVRVEPNRPDRDRLAGREVVQQRREHAGVDLFASPVFVWNASPGSKWAKDASLLPIPHLIPHPVTITPNDAATHGTIAVFPFQPTTAARMNPTRTSAAVPLPETYAITLRNGLDVCVRS
jgi:hypothetical protein